MRDSKEKTKIPSLLDDKKEDELDLKSLLTENYDFNSKESESERERISAWIRKENTKSVQKNLQYASRFGIIGTI